MEPEKRKDLSDDFARAVAVIIQIEPVGARRMIDDSLKILRGPVTDTLRWMYNEEHG